MTPKTLALGNYFVLAGSSPLPAANRVSMHNPFNLDRRIDRSQTVKTQRDTALSHSASRWLPEGAHTSRYRRRVRFRLAAPLAVVSV